MTVRTILVGLICSLGGLGFAAWLTAVCLFAAAARLPALAAWPLAGVIATAALGAWTFPASWWVVALVSGFPAALFTTGWYFVIADEGQRNPTWLACGVLALLGALAMAFLVGAWQRARARRRAAVPAA